MGAELLGFYRHSLGFTAVGQIPLTPGLVPLVFKVLYPQNPGEPPRWILDIRVGVNR